MTLAMHLCSACNRRTINFYDDDDNDDDDDDNDDDMETVYLEFVVVLQVGVFLEHSDVFVEPNERNRFRRLLRKERVSPLDFRVVFVGVFVSHGHRRGLPLTPPPDDDDDDDDDNSDDENERNYDTNDETDLSRPRAYT